MIVYGDPHFQADLSNSVSLLEQGLNHLEGGNLDALRRLLIQCGQLEQAIADVSEDLPCLGPVQQCTDFLAAALVELFWEGRCDPEHLRRVTRPALAVLRNQFNSARVPAWQSATIVGDVAREFTFKVPEGFEFYSLFPEQYSVTARRWLETRQAAGADSVCVIGLRGIGTTLSAVVAATLRSAGVQVDRRTVRPSGHPFDRQTLLPQLNVSRGAWAFVVDEGPGISGSSMASVAKALGTRGVDPARIIFLPGHEGEPGPAASAETRHWWSLVSRSCTPLHEVRWRTSTPSPASPSFTIDPKVAQTENDPGSSGAHFTTSLDTSDLLASLRQETERLLSVPVERIDDLSGGQWRKFAFSHDKEWPAAAARFERPKYLFTLATGDAVLWKFFGLGAWVVPGLTTEDRMRNAAEMLRSKGWVPPLLSTFRGFMATPWVTGRRLTPSDNSEPPLIERLAEYIAYVTGPPLELPEHKAAIERLEEMVYANVTEAFDANTAAQVRFAAEPARSFAPSVTYGDGRLAPCEWVRTPTGGLVKTDYFGHDTDHTAIGKQSYLWDVAGALVEWELQTQERARLLEAFARQGMMVDSAVLRFFEIAYRSFRLGQTSLCLELESCPQERSRLELDRDRHHGALAALLKQTSARS